MPRYAKTIPVAVAIQLLVNLNVVLASPIAPSLPVSAPSSANLNGNKCPDPCFLNSLSLCDVIDSVTNPADYDRYCPAGISLPTFHEHIEKCKGTLSSQPGGFAGGLPVNAPSKGSESNTIGIGPWSGKPGQTGASSGDSFSVSVGSDKPSAGSDQPGVPSKSSGPSSVGVGLGSGKPDHAGASSGDSVSVGGVQAGVPPKGSGPSSVGADLGSGKPDHAGASSGDSVTVGLDDSSNIGHPSVPIPPSSGGAVRPPTDSNSVGSTSVSIPDSIQVVQDSNLGHPSVSTAPSSGAIAQAPSDSISVGPTMVFIPSTGVLSGVDGLGSKGNGAPGDKDDKGEGCGCGDEIPL